MDYATLTVQNCVRPNMKCLLSKRDQGFLKQSGKQRVCRERVDARPERQDGAAGSPGRVTRR